MKKQPLKLRHPIVLTAAALLTVFSIIGSVTAAGFIPLPESTHSAIDDKQYGQSKNTESIKKKDTSATKMMKKAEFMHDEFNSVVKPRLSNCFNCGVVIAIEAMPDSSIAFDSTENQNGLLAQNIENYLDAHRENARIIALVDGLTDDHSVINRNKGSNTDSMTYLIKVRMPDGSQHTITQDVEPEHNVGDTIRLINERTITA